MCLSGGLRLPPPAAGGAGGARGPGRFPHLPPAGGFISPFPPKTPHRTRSCSRATTRRSSSPTPFRRSSAGMPSTWSCSPDCSTTTIPSWATPANASSRWLPLGPTRSTGAPADAANPHRRGPRLPRDGGGLRRAEAPWPARRSDRSDVGRPRGVLLSGARVRLRRAEALPPAVLEPARGVRHAAPRHPAGRVLLPALCTVSVPRCRGRDHARHLPPPGDRLLLDVSPLPPPRHTTRRGAHRRTRLRPPRCHGDQGLLSESPGAFGMDPARVPPGGPRPRAALADRLRAPRRRDRRGDARREAPGRLLHGARAGPVR